MAYLGRQGVTAPLTSADIPDNSITTAKIVDSNITTAKILDDNVTAAKIPAGAVSSDVLYLENNTSTQTLSGTYSTERLYFNDSYQLTGDVTVTGHLALGSIADEDVVITQDSTERTITGSGTLESGELLSSKETDLTGMTGELGSAVTGSPALNLGNTTGTLGSGVTFPAGHIINIQTTYLPTQDYATTGGTTWVNYWSPTYDPQKNNSTVYAWLDLQGMANHNGNWQPVWNHKYSISGNNITNLTDMDGNTRGWENPTTSNNATFMEIQQFELLRPVTLSGGTSTITYALSFKNNSSAWYSHTLRIYGYTSGTDSKGSSITFQEVAQ